MLLGELNLASCWSGFLNEMRERKCLTPVWSKGGDTKGSWNFFLGTNSSCGAKHTLCDQKI